MTPVDPFDRLRARNPAPPGAPLDDDPGRAEGLLQRVLDVELRRRRRSRRVVAAAVIAASVAAAAAAWVVTRPASDRTQTTCFAAADLDADRAGLAGEDDPIDACRAVWRRGTFGGTDVPQMSACVLDSGTIGVFPGRGGAPCDALGLDRADLSVVDPVIDLQTRLADRFGTQCVPVADASAVVRDELDRAGLTEWTVRTPGEIPPERPCASVAVDEIGETISIVPIPDP